MFKFGSISGYDQLVISEKLKDNESDSADSNKWTKHKREVFSCDVPKMLVTQRHVFAAHLNRIVIMDTKPLSDVSEIFIDRKEFSIDVHSSPVNCFGVEETALLLCSCSDEHVTLSKWDSLLGHWDTKVISEDDGRILSCSVAFRSFVIYVALFKSDILIVYKIVSAHPPAEPGPLILDSIECFATLDKVKELTSWSKSVFFGERFYIVGVASGNTVSLKFWEAYTKDEQSQLKLRSYRLVSNLKSAIGADLLVEVDHIYVLIVASDGVSEIFSFSTDTCDVLYRFKIEDNAEPSPSRSLLDSPSSLQTSSSSMIQIESRILSAKFFQVKVPDFPMHNRFRDSVRRKVDETGDAHNTEFVRCEDRKLNDSNEEDCIGIDDLSRSINAILCPKLLIATVTTKGVSIIDVIGGQVEMSVSHGDLLKDDTIFIQNARMAINADAREIILGLQSCLTRIVFSRRFTVTAEGIPSPDKNQSQISLIPREILGSKSVLRKKIKSPPRQSPSYPVIPHRKVPFFKSPGNQPSWARARSRPHIRSSHSKTRIAPPLSARSQSTSGVSRSLLKNDGESLTARIVNIPSTGSYESESSLSFQDSEKIVLPSCISQGISVFRMAATSSGKHLAFGGSLSPLMISKTKPFQVYRIFKDIGKVTNVNFNFAGNLLLVASSDCKTAVVDWQNSKELLSFEFSSKFNEHVHSQFYFMDKFILQPEENKLSLYSYAKRDTGYIKLKAGDFQLSGQSITALAAANQFYSNLVIAGLSNKTVQIFDTNVEKTLMTIPSTHGKPISCIRINEAPKGPHATHLCDVFLTASSSNLDPIKLWDIRSSRCILRISDVNQTAFVPTARPNISPCGRYIVSGYEDSTISFYDIRNVKARLCTMRKLGSTVLDCCFDANLPMVWGGCRNGSLLNFYIP